MERLFNWIKNHKYLTAIIIILVFLLQLIIVHWLFKSSFKTPWLEAEWEAGDVLNYIIGFETSISTIMLSFIALYQTERIKKSEEFYEAANTKRPFFIIDKVIVEEDNRKNNISFNDNTYQFNTEKSPEPIIILKNVGDGIANNFTYEPHAYMGEVPNCKPSLYIPVQGTHSIQRALCTDNETIEISYQNMLGVLYKQKITINVEHYECYYENNHAEENYYTTNIQLISAQIPIGFINE